MHCKGEKSPLTTMHTMLFCLVVLPSAAQADTTLDASTSKNNKENTFNQSLRQKDGNISIRWIFLFPIRHPLLQPARPPEKVKHQSAGTDYYAKHRGVTKRPF